MACAMGCMPPPPAPCSTRQEQQDGQRGRRAAEKAGDGEDRDAEDEEVAAAHQARGPAAERKHDGVRDQVAGEHPGGLIGAGAERAADVRQRHVGDGGVEHLHEGRQRHRHGDQPGIDPRLPVRVQVKTRGPPLRRPRSGSAPVALACGSGIGRQSGQCGVDRGQQSLLEFCDWFLDGFLARFFALWPGKCGVHRAPNAGSRRCIRRL